MQALFLQLVMPHVKAKLEQLSQELARTWDFSAFEQELDLLFGQITAALTSIALHERLSSPTCLAQLKQLGGQLGLRFKEYRTVTVYLANGYRIPVWMPFFIKRKPKRGPKKRGPHGRGRNLGLQVLGFIGRGSPQFVHEVVQMAVLCPSFEIARQVLLGRGIQIDVTTIQRYCRDLAQAGLERRGEVSLCGDEKLAGYTLVIGIDGGRLRERRKKRGRKKAGQKRQGYHTDWREPKLFVIYLQDAQGQLVREFAPLYDATMGDNEVILQLLQQYLRSLPLVDVARIVFCGDGAPWIWAGVEKLCDQMGLDQNCVVYQVLDYPHAKQNLQQIIDLVGSRLQKKEKVSEKWFKLLWEGNLTGIQQEIERLLSGTKRAQALKKLSKYFHHNEQRMRYSYFDQIKIPCGSGCVESAIRRIINLRLKAAGTFWKKETAEQFLFLRSQLLSGRWLVMMRNLTRQYALKMLSLEHDSQPAISSPPSALLVAGRALS